MAYQNLRARQLPLSLLFAWRLLPLLLPMRRKRPKHPAQPKRPQKPLGWMSSILPCAAASKGWRISWTIGLASPIPMIRLRLICVLFWTPIGTNTMMFLSNRAFAGACGCRCWKSA